MKIDQKFLLQICVAIGACVPVVAGLGGVVCGALMLGDIADPTVLDSHFRYLSGLLLGIGIAFWSCIPHIEKRGARFRILAFIVVIGGLGRLWALIEAGVPDRAMMFGLSMELVVTPLLALWQHRISRT